MLLWMELFANENDWILLFSSIYSLKIKSESFNVAVKKIKPLLFYYV